MTRASVVIPTHERRDVVCANVAALAHQSAGAEAFEVVVVADGCTDGTVAALRGLSVPFPLTVLEQADLGASSARNAGARAASGRVLVFLDDDMRPDPGLVEAHLVAQAGAAQLCIGHFTTPVSCRTESVHSGLVNAWWDHRFHRMTEPHHRYTFLDVCTGHMSVPRDAFLGLGGFDEAVGRWAGEDYEFGYRWIVAGRGIRFLPGARSEHLDRPRVDKALRRAYHEGRGHVLMARRHPEILARLPLAEGMDRLPAAGVFRRRELDRRRAARLARRLAAPARAADAARLRRAFRALFSRARLAAYWHGALDEAGGEDAFRRLVQEAVIAAPPRRVPVLDLQSDPGPLRTQLEHPHEALGLAIGPRPFACLVTLPGEEPVRWPHVLRLIESRMTAEEWHRLAAPEHAGEAP